jgi:RNA-directed DNA polymerase
LKKHYFTRTGMRSVFYATTIDSHGKKERLFLFKAADLPIKRHEKVAGAATPYDPEWSDYFKRRATKREAQREADRRFLSSCTLLRQLV